MEWGRGGWFRFVAAAAAAAAGAGAVGVVAVAVAVAVCVVVVVVVVVDDLIYDVRGTYCFAVFSFGVGASCLQRKDEPIDICPPCPNTACIDGK